MKMIVDHLIAIGNLVTGHNLVYYGLAELDSNWNSFIYGITLRFDSIYFDELYRYLLAHKGILDNQHGNSMYNANLARFVGINIKSQGYNQKNSKNNAINSNYDSYSSNSSSSSRVNWNLQEFLSQRGGSTTLQGLDNRYKGKIPGSNNNFSYNKVQCQFYT